MRIKRSSLPPLSTEETDRLNGLVGKTVAADDPENPIQTSDELVRARRRGRPHKGEKNQAQR